MNIQKLKEQLEKERLERSKKPVFERAFLDFVDWVNRTDFIQEIADSLHRITRGYTESDIYNINSFVINKVRPVLKEYVRYEEQHGMSLPSDFASDPAGWLLVIKEIEFSFDHEWKDEHEEGYDPTNAMTIEEVNEFNAKVQKGFDLFGKYLMNLWD